MKMYEFEIERLTREGSYLGANITSYKEDDGNFVTDKPETNEESREVIESMKGLVRLLGLHKLKVKLEVER